MNNWPRLKMAEIAPIIRREVIVSTEKEYPELGVRSFGKGTFQKPSLKGSDAGSKRLFEIHAGDLIFSNVFAWEGAIAIATKDDHGRFGSHRFISCQVDQSKARAEYIKYYLTCSQDGIAQIQAASPGGAGRNRTLGLGKLGEITIPLPPMQEQCSILDKIERLQDKTRQLNEHLAAIEADANSLLAERFSKIIQAAPVKPLAEIAPIIRRPATISSDEKYTEIGIRSFYKGIFHRRTVSGSEFSWQDLFIIKKDDLVFSNIMAWERAIAIASAEDNNCIANHRMLACEVKNELATPEFAWYYFTTPTGFSKIEAASPGTAARNKTLKSTDLMSIKIPTPSLAHQQEFSQLFNIVRELKNKHAEISRDNEKLIPATLERIFLR